MNKYYRRYLMRKSINEERKEDGFTLVEMLIVIGLIVVIGGIVTSLVINATQSNQKFSASNMTQGELLDSVARITTQTAYATEILMAEPTQLKMKTMEDGIEYETTYFYWADNGASNVPSGVNAAKLPDQKSFLEYKVNKANNAVMVTNLISNYNRATGEKPIFTYFTVADSVIPTPVQPNNLPAIKRIGVYFSITPTDREAPLEIATSAVPRMAITSPGAATGAAVPIPQATVLTGKLTPGTRVSNLSWTSVAGATQYNLYRDGALLKSFPPTTTKYDDPGLAWGTTYDYSVIVTGYAGQSSESNHVKLTVVPEKTRFLNINTLKGLSDVNSVGDESGTSNAKKGDTYTVARGLDNKITWESRFGATSYKLVDANGVVVYNGANTSATQATAYGDYRTYTVIPSNTGLYGSGGAGLASDPVSLISPPKQPVITVTANDNTAVVANSTNTVKLNAAVPYAKGYIYDSGATAATSKEFVREATAANKSQTVSWGSTTWYGATAYNDAGNSPESINVKADQKPGPFNITGISQTARSIYVNTLEFDGVAQSNQTGKITADWGGSTGAKNYSYSIVLRDSYGGTQVANTSNRSGVITESALTTQNITPGSTYNYNVTATAPNGLTRGAAQKIFQTAPDVPRHGTVHIVCSNNSNGLQYLNQVYTSQTRPRFGGADLTTQKQFSNNGQGSGLDKSFAPGDASQMTNSNGRVHGYTAGFTLQNTLNMKSGVNWGQTQSDILRAYGTYLSYNGPGTYWDFTGCAGSGAWQEPTAPCYGVVWYAGCTMGTGRPSWTTS